MAQAQIAGMASDEKTKFLGRTYGWMAAALFISAAVAFWTSLNIFTEDGHLSTLGSLLFANNGIGFIVVAVLEIAVVFILSALIRKMTLLTAIISFIFYSMLNGLTLSSIFVVYKIDSIAAAFLSSAVLFLGMSIYGSFTKSDLTKAGRYLMMGVMGIILASVIQFVISLITGAPLAMMDLLISIATVIVFTGLTAYDSQKILRTAEYANSSDDYKKVSLLAALEIYLDFINIFLSLLRLFGRRNSD